MNYDRDLVRGSLDMMVLSTLTDGPKYGHLIQKLIRQVSHDKVKLPGGTLYPLLHRLEGQGLITARQVKTPEGNRRWYELTRAGWRRLRQDAGQWQDFVGSVARLLKPALENEPPVDDVETSPA